MAQEIVKTQNGTNKTVIADNDADLKDAVKVAKSEGAPVYPNINHPVQKGHDQVAVGPDVSKVLVDGEGAHNSPYNAIDDNGNETGNKDVRAAGLDEPAYKSVPVLGNDQQDPRFATDAEVAAAKKDAEPANDFPEGEASSK